MKRQHRRRGMKMIAKVRMYRINVTAERDGLTDTFTAFHWRGNPEHGIARAKREAVEFGWTLHSVSAIPCDGFSVV